MRGTGRLALVVGLVAALSLCRGQAEAVPVVLDPAYEVALHARNVELASDIVFGYDGVSFVANGENTVSSRITRVPAGGGLGAPFGPLIFDPDAVLVAPQGGVYIGAASSVYWLSEDGSHLDLLSSGGHLSNVTCFQYDTAGDLLVSSLFNGNIVRLAPDGTQTVVYRTGLAEVTTFIFSSDGELYIGTRHGPRVYRFLADNDLELIVETDHAALTGIAFDALQRMFVADLHGLYLVDPNLHQATQVIELDRCEGLTYHNGALYMAESLADEVWRTYVIPEPVTLSLLGLGGLGLLARRRSRREPPPQ